MDRFEDQCEQRADDEGRSSRLSSQQLEHRRVTEFAEAVRNALRTSNPITEAPSSGGSGIRLNAQSNG
jgi:hypothetical protein